MKIKEQTTSKNLKRGISLIVLVITIIVMIILAVAVILSLSSNGIIDRANEAVRKTNKAQIETLAQTIWADGYLENKTAAQIKEDIVKAVGKDEAKYYSIVVTGSGVTVEELPKDWVDSVSEIVNGVPIPKGFVVSPYEDEDEKNEGLVIYEILPTDTSTDIATIDGSHQNSLEKRNQYVWVPVDKETFETTNTEFKRQNFGLSDTINTDATLGTDYWEVVPTTDETTDNNKLYLVQGKTLAEVQAMYASVKEYGGFYIARYEAGLGADLTVPNVQRKEKGTAANLPTGHDNVHIKMGQIPYTYIPWTWESVMDSEDDGAVEVARSIYPNDSSNTTGVISTLTYGVQWDRTVEWLRTNGKYGDENEEVSSVTNSIAYGNYKDHQITKGDLNPNAKYAIYNTTNYTLEDYSNVTYTDGESQVEKDTTTSWALSTGALKDAKVNNIYDMAGNMYEWTMEGSSSNRRVLRGGRFNDNGSSCPVALRGSTYPNNAYDFLSFRPALYIKK